MSDTGGGDSAGAMMRAARERQGLHIAALAAAIKVSPRKLDALENDRWQELPDTTFVRALAQTVCRQLKIDARPVLDRLPAAGVVALGPPHGQLGAAFHDRPGRGETTFALAAVRPMVWAGLALMLAALVVYLLPARLFEESPTAPAPVVALPAQVASAVLAVPGTPASAAVGEVSGIAVAAVAAAASGASAPSVPDTPPPPLQAAAPPVAAPATAKAISTPVAAATAAPAASIAMSAAARGGMLRLRSSAASWVEVRDAVDRVIFSRILRAGEEAAVDGAPPLRVTVGNAAATEVAFRGQAVDLGSRSRDNVARLELQ